MSGLNIKTLWAGTCLPAKVFPLVMAGIVVFNFWIGAWGEAFKNIIVAAIGTSALWLLCTSGMELLAYMVLAVPVIFIIFLLALIVFDQSLLSVTHDYQKKPDRRNSGCSDCNSCEDYTC
jgi:hypothetical protein